MRRYLYYKTCELRNKIIAKLVKEFTDDIYKNEMMYNEMLNAIPFIDHKKMSSSCTICTVLYATFLIISICISSAFIYSHCYIKKDNNLMLNHNTQTTLG